ncbi:MAG: hypothetical protein ACPGEC_02370 [Flavobacteriales bacterium]
MIKLIKPLALSICFIGLLTSCETCKECSFEETVSYLNRPQFSGISPNEFNDINYFDESSFTQALGEVCGKNLDKLESGNDSDTTAIQTYEDNNGNDQTVPGGVFKIETKIYTCN